MKKITAFIIILALLCGCSAKGNDSAPDVTAADGTAAAVSVNAEVYALIEGDYPAYFDYSYNSIGSERFAVADDGRFVRSHMRTSGVDLIEYTMNGSERMIGSYSSIPEAMAFMGNELYILGMKWGNGGAVGINLYRLDEETKNTELTDSFDIRVKDGCAMSGNADELYIIGSSPDSGSQMYSLYYGANTAVFRIHGGEMVQLPVDGPTAVCAKKTGGAVIAGIDDNGVYVTQYIDGEFTERIYTDVEMITNMADVDGEHIAYTADIGGESRLCISSLDNMSTAELIPDMKVNGERLGAAGGYCFFELLDRTEVNDFAVVRVKISEYYNGNIPLDFIYTDRSGETPFSNGYMINRMKLSGEEAALKILSQDKDYDICYISTSDAVSENLKSRGSFYPLNDIAGVSDYINKCFPGIKEAFTDENGNIWALPVVSETSYIFSESSDSGFSEMSFSEFADLINEKYAKVFSFYDLKRTLLEYQAAEHKCFDTPEFREAAEKFRGSDKLNTKMNENPSPFEMLNSFKILPYNDMLLSLKYSEYYVCGLPCAEKGNVIIPDITFMCVNPNSERLADVLGYIERVTAYQLTRPDKFILTPENGVYTDDRTVRRIAELCSDAKVYFTYPHELYWDDFDRYLSGEISLDDFIKEADRKLQTYLNE